LTEESLEWLAVLDPEAGRLDDFQLATPGQLDAFQVKWSQAGGQLSWSDLRAYLVDLVADRRSLAEQHRDRRVIGHLYSDRVASSSRISEAPSGHGNATVAYAVAQLLQPATAGILAPPAQLPDAWRWLWRELAERCGLSEQGLLTDFALVRIELGRPLPSLTEVAGRDAASYRRDLDELLIALLRIATDPRQLVRLSKAELLDRLGESWRQRLELRSVHEFPLPVAYEPVHATAEELAESLQRFTSGYVALVGSPGSGKSTLLTQQLRGHEDVVARYYAYVRGRADVGSMRAEASAFLHDLVLTLERGGLPRGPVPVDFDVPALTARLTRHLQQLGDRYRREGRPSIILIDGLDHVERERDVQQPLLRYLPRPEELPDGVLIMVGSQTVRMLHPDIRSQLEQPGRTIQMAPLGRSEVADLALAWRVQVDADRLWEVSGGHPLLLAYLLQELRDLPAERQEAQLAVTPPYGGDVRTLYLRLWTAVEDDEELVELLGLACRMRGPVDLAWLREHGQPGRAVRRLREQAAHLFRREGDRWYFFHESFRLFLQDRTARVNGEADPAEDRRLHRQLADMCRASPQGQPQSWELLFHLVGAEEHAAVLATATPAFFRAQLVEGLRPRELVAADIRLAVRSLAVVQDPMALVRLAIAASELSQRGYHQPDREAFLSLLVRTGQWRLAVEHMEAEGESFAAEDSRTARLRISLLLHDSGLHEEARRVFEANEPLEILGGRAAARQLRGPFELLYAWAAAAAVIRGPQAVIEAARQLQLPRDPDIPDQEAEDPTSDTRAWMLTAAAVELESHERMADSDSLLAALDTRRQSDRAPWVRAVSQQWTDHADRMSDLVRLVTERLTVRDLDATSRVLVAEGLLKAGSRDAAAAWIDGLPQPALTRARELSRGWEAQEPRYRLNRLLAALGRRPDVESIVPAPADEWRWGEVHVARVTVAIAQLHGQAWAGEPLAAGEFMAAARQILRLFEIGGSARSANYELRSIRPPALVQLLHVAQSHGRATTQALWQEYERRWRDRPALLRHEGHQVLPAAQETGIIPRGVILQRVRDLESLVQASSHDAETPDELTKLAGTMDAVGLVDDARRLLWQAVSATLVIYHRKDYQLSEWIGLLGPQLDGETGAQLARWLAGAIADLNEQLDVGQAQDAAMRLLRIDSAHRPGHAWQVGAWLQDHDVVDWDDRLAALLNAQIHHAGDRLWWGVLVDQLIPIASEAPAGLLIHASQRAVDRHGVAWLRQHLQTLLTRLDVEAQPWTREVWQVAVADCAVKHHIELADLGLPDELHPERRPVRSRTRGTGEDERDAFLAAHNTVEAVLTDAAAADLSDFRSEWAEAVDLVADRMDLQQVEHAGAIFSDAGTNQLRIHRRLARRALDLGAPDVAAKLAEGVLANAQSHSWRRNWDGGSLLDALRLLAELDPIGTRDRAYRRFAADAASDPYLLSEIAWDLSEYLDLFDINDPHALGQEVEQYLRILLDDPTLQPRASLDDAADAPTALARTGLDLLASPYRLAVTTAQRALLAELQAADERMQVWMVGALESQDEELVLRVLSVLEAALQVQAPVGGELADAVQRWTTAEHLGIRLASRRLATRLGRTLEPTPTRPLPAAYRIVIPEQERPTGMQTAEPLGRDDLEVISTLAESELQGLARTTEVDSRALTARVANLARRLAGNTLVDDSRWQASASPLGWTFHKPSISLWEQATARVAAELADAGRLAAEDALLLSTGPGYDPTLIAARPSPRPDAVAPLPEPNDAIPISPERWLEGLGGAEDRLARGLPGGWLVIGEHTELRRLDDTGPCEHRIQALGVLSHLDPEDRPGQQRRTPIAEAEQFAAAEATPLLYHWDPSFRGPSAWLALHPRLARACAWTPDQDALIGWRDDEGPVALSLWWRFGWLDSTSWIGQEVGEGWLVLVQERALDRLAEALHGQLAVAWQVKRDFLARDQPTAQRSGVRHLLRPMRNSPRARV